jgi:hypothetical protein
MVRADSPTRRDAESSRAPAVCASLTSVRIISRSRRPRPPRGGPLFFEDWQCRGFGERLLLASELPLELSDALCRRHGSLVFPKRQPPLLQLGEQEPLMPSLARCPSLAPLAGRSRHSPREAPDHFLLVRKGEWFGHVAIAVLPHSGSFETPDNYAGTGWSDRTVTWSPISSSRSVTYVSNSDPFRIFVEMHPRIML